MRPLELAWKENLCLRDALARSLRPVARWLQLSSLIYPQLSFLDCASDMLQLIHYLPALAYIQSGIPPRAA